MLNYLKGYVAQIIKLSNNRHTLILEVQQLGYEIQISSHLAQALANNPELIQIYTHLQIKEEVPQLYGFASSQERDIFRQLIGVSGIGPQLASSLIDYLGIDNLVQAIVEETVTKLTKVPGVGNKTAERLILELKGKLKKHYKTEVVAILQEIEVTLLALGYEDQEVAKAITLLKQDEEFLKNSQLEELLKRVIS
jgi:Holliday junction DNA helicase RuvA